ncbi:rcc01693 family protein [Aureimonas sp. AU12]|uniref:rcc01693 family protein n=1 Tax=Aureimonas sp. AU12 TaxID=1638161 RepID=UPI000780CDAF
MSAAAPDPAAGAAAFPWDEAMSLGLGVLGLAPAAFWRMTPRELARALGPLDARIAAPPSRAGLDEMMMRFPDRR